MSHLAQHQRPDLLNMARTNRKHAHHDNGAVDFPCASVSIRAPLRGAKAFCVMALNSEASVNRGEKMNGQAGQKPSNSKMVRRYFVVWQAEIAKEKGKEPATQVMAKVQTRLESLYISRQRTSHPALQMYLGDNILPVPALYQVLREQGQDEQMALNSVEHLCHATCQSQRKQLQLIGRLPFVFQFYRLAIRQMMNKNYPPEG